ncbi:uncharacterized protein LOC114526665 [Dendronephthya gigantea]|uniref:uncharacterized protein LOC114526665 n=1 Tax=Dendronephthya gigantea TaxID=151771 RepID=UPI00106C4576|nr:uncharacterized protein LOC114526665 [Dendronephthya gigantea]
MEAATNHLQAKLDAGENESVLSNGKTSPHSKASVSEKSSLRSDVKSKSSVQMQASMAVKEQFLHATSLTQIELNATQTEDRLKEMEKEQSEKEAQMKKIATELELSKQRTEEARIIAEINKSKAEKATAQDHGIVQDCIQDEFTVTSIPKLGQVLACSAFHLKGVNLPNFSGYNKTEYESWKAAFNVMVDSRNISVGAKMLRLQNSLSGKALDMIKALGFSEAAYERAKVKLEKRFGGERGQQIKHLTTLRNWPKLRPRNLQDLEEFQALLEQILINMKDGAPLQDQSLNLSAKEKLTEIDVQNYKHWLLDHAQEDCFKSLVDWIELRINVMEEAKEKTGALHRREQERSNRLRDDKKPHLGFSARSLYSKCCVVSTCKKDHPPWVCSAFKALPVAKRKELIAKTGRCFRCLAAGHHAKNCSNYPHEETSSDVSTRCQLSTKSPPFYPNQQAAGDPPHVPATPGTENAQSRSKQSNGQRAYKTSRADNVSLMVLPALISNGRKDLQVNVMLDPCSTGSYVSEAAAN